MSREEIEAAADLVQFYAGTRPNPVPRLFAKQPSKFEGADASTNQTEHAWGQIGQGGAASGI